MKYSFSLWMTASLVLLLTTSTTFGKVKNIIFFIADGWGYCQVRATDCWNGSPAPYEAFPVQLGMSTYSWNALQEASDGYSPDSAGVDFTYLMRRATDSAAAATALSTGVKTYNAAINVDPNKKPLETVIQAAERIGWATGVITSVPFSHATPAGFVAHDVHRNNYAAIAVEMIDSSACEVIMGAGHPYYDANGAPVEPNDKAFAWVGGRDCWQRLVGGAAGGDCDGDGCKDAWSLIHTRSEFQRLAVGATPKRVLGIPPVASTLFCDRDGQAPRNDPRPPYSEPVNPSIPTLAEMTCAALNVLDNDPDGFFLMVEGGAIDWANHDNTLGRMIEEMNDFNVSLSAAVTWVEAHGGWSETLIIVTGDHECGYLLGPESGVGTPPRYNPILDRGKGVMPGFHYYHDNHTNSLIPLFARGAGAYGLVELAVRRDPVRGDYIDNTDVAKLIFQLLTKPE